MSLTKKNHLKSDPDRHCQVHYLCHLLLVELYHLVLPRLFPEFMISLKIRHFREIFTSFIRFSNSASISASSSSSLAREFKNCSFFTEKNMENNDLIIQIEKNPVNLIFNPCHQGRHPLRQTLLVK